MCSPISSRFAILVIFTSVGFHSVASQESPVFVNPDVVTIRDFEGWGTSLAWWPDVLGHMTEDVIDEVTTALFSPTALNFNIVRYTIGGTTPGNYTCGPYRPGGATETFLDGPGLEYDWTRDPRQRNVLTKAKALGVDTFEAFSNSPPQWMTISGCSKGNPLGGLLHGNLAEGQADAFAEYVTEVIKHFHEEWDITFQTFAPFNEPFGLGGLGGWFGESSEQEGCNMARPVMAAVIKSINRTFTENGLDFITITAADETQMNTETGTQNYFRENGISSLFTKVNVHGYWDIAGNRRDLLSMACHRDGHKLWMSEMGWGSTPPTNMTQGLDIANRILVDLKKLLPSAWVYWQAVEGHGQWGVISIPYDNPEATLEDINYNSGYFSLMQFSKYIRKGYNILSVNDDATLAAYNGNNLVLVVVNNEQESVQRSYSLNLFSSFGTVTASRTSPTEQNAGVTPEPIIEANQLVYNAPPQSITTIEISNVVHESSGNLLQNGDFETQGAWRVELGNGGINSDNTWRGGFSGYLDSTDSEVQLIQTVTAPKDGNFYLTATCATEGTGAKLGILVGGLQVTELTIQGAGYATYGISFPAKVDEDISVYFHSVQEDTFSYIDDASLFYK